MWPCGNWSPEKEEYAAEIERQTDTRQTQIDRMAKPNHTNLILVHITPKTPKVAADTPSHHISETNKVRWQPTTMHTQIETSTRKPSYYTYINKILPLAEAENVYE